MLPWKDLKKIIAIFRGEVAPSLILLSVATGFWFGLTPGWYGIHLFLLAVALILNVHFGIFLLTAALSKAICAAAAPVMFHVGAWVQDTLSGWLTFLAGIPVIGFTDFSRYAVAAAMLVGPVVGLLLGVGLATSVTGFRKRWLSLEENSDTFTQWHNRRWVRLLDWWFVGTRTDNVREVLQRKPKYVRKKGIVLAVVLVTVSGIAVQMVQDDMARDYAARGLTKTNGAEVNLESLDLNVLGASISAQGLEATDPDKPENNRISIGELSAAISWWNLLTGKLVVTDLTLSKVAFDQPRREPGSVLPSSSIGTVSFDREAFKQVDVDIALVEGYFKNAQAVRDKLKQVSQYLPDRKLEKEVVESKPIPESYLAYLTAHSPKMATPRVIIKKMQLEHVAIPVDRFGDCSITCENMSDAPTVAGLPVAIRVKSNAFPTTLEITSHYDHTDGGATITAKLEDVDLRSLQSNLKAGNAVTFDGGTASVNVEGNATRQMIDLELRANLKDMQANAAGSVCGLDSGVAQEAFKALDKIDVTLSLVGPITQPVLVFDGAALRETLSNALVGAGKNELARQVDAVAGEELSKVGVDSGKIVQDPLKAGKSALDGLLGKPDDKSDKP
jgi:uncharacterized protein (TIGR03546 family)